MFELFTAHPNHWIVCDQSYQLCIAMIAKYLGYLQVEWKELLEEVTAVHTFLNWFIFFVWILNQWTKLWRQGWCKFHDHFTAVEFCDTWILCIFLKLAQKIQDASQETYSKMQDTARISEINTKISPTLNREVCLLRITKYSNAMKGLWQEIDHYHSTKMKHN